jgi:hypothetical protein
MPVPSTPPRGVRALGAADLAYMYIDEAEAEAHGMLSPWQAARAGALAHVIAAAAPCVAKRKVTSAAIIAANKQPFKLRRPRPPAMNAAKTPTQDEETRRTAAAAAVDMSLAWTPSAGLAAAWPAMSGNQQLAFRAACVRRISKFEARVVYQHLRVWEQWRSWSERRKLPLLASALPIVEEFIESFTEAPTAARARWNSMAWLRTHLRSPYSVDPVHKPGRAATDGKVTAEQQAPVCEPELLVYLEQRATELRRAGDWRFSIVLGALIESYGCLRFAHLQRSNLKQRNAAAFTGECFRGKARVAGTRPGFQWQCPSVGITGIPIAVWIFEAWKRWHKVRPQHLGIACDYITGNAVSLAQYNTVIKEILAPALDEDSASAPSVSSYSFRRILPTLADIRQLPWEKRTPLGGWKTQGGRDKDKSAMPIRYADRKDITEQAIKVTAVRVLAAAVQIAERPATWEAVRAALPKVDTAAIEQKVEQDVAVEEEVIMASGASAGPATQRRLKLKKDFRGITWGMKARLQEVNRGEGKVAAERAWLCPSKGAGLLHFLVSQESGQTLCRRHQKPGKQAFRGPATSGTGVIQAQALGKRMCPRCVQRLPLADSALLAQTGGACAR